MAEEKIRRRTLEDAVRQGRAAVLPPWLSVGNEVWWWRECWCEDEICDADCVTAVCPVNRGLRWWDDEVRQCARVHPILDHETIFSVAAFFTKNGVEWSVNDGTAVPEKYLRMVYFSTREDALKVRPREVKTIG